MSDDASATFRGFRHQALYVLSRILTDLESAKRTYRPEGAEDLAIYDENLQLIEAIQVKDYTSDLYLSNLKHAFWTRFHSRKKKWPKSKTMLATFGGIGPELTGAIMGNPAQRTSVIKKLCVKDAIFNIQDAEEMLNSLKGNILRPIAEDLQNAVLNALRATNVGGDVESAAELLMYWVFEASEQQRALTRQDLLAQLERIGSYLAALRDSSSEWGTNVLPLSLSPLSEERKAKLRADFRNGVQAKWEHILANADCVRNKRLAEIHHKFNTARIVIVRGASGQGKSTLGWRYMRDFWAEGLRFYVRHVESRTHASKIANALGDHIRKLKLDALVYVDVSPSDNGWSVLLSELATSGLKVLAAVREEDFRRANLSLGDFHYAEVALDRLTREEAVSIFADLHQSQTAVVLDFEDAWSRFTESEGGPLLEFTHLIIQGERLHSRINSQIVRLQNDAAANQHGVTQNHIELLALAAVANETGARASLPGLCALAGLSQVSHPLRVLEDEYLVRLESGSGESTVEPLHMLRSKAVVDSLFGDIPSAWLQYALRVLPHIQHADIEPFLLAAFSRHSEHTDAIVEALNVLTLRSWSQAAGIAASLLWEGINRYEKANRDAIIRAIALYDTAWWLTCDAFVASDKAVFDGIRETFKSIFKHPPEPFVLTPKKAIFALFLNWASKATAPASCNLATDWRGAGYISFWIGRYSCPGSMRDTLETILPEKFTDELDIEHIAAFVSGRANLADDAFGAWHARIARDQNARFVRDTESEFLADDGISATVYFSTPLADIVCKHDPKATDWHWQTMKRVRLLAMLFPNRQTYGSHGLGLSALQLGRDPTLKCIPANSIHCERTTQLNALFLGLVSFRHQRVDTWKQYSDAALLYRRKVSECFRKLHRGWAKLLSSDSPLPSAFKELPGAELDSLKLLGKLPMFPRCAVDEWGFLSESRAEIKPSSNQRQTDLFRRFGAWGKSFGDFESGVGLFLSNVLPVTVIFASEHKGYSPTENDTKATHLAVVNLAAAWEVLPKMQKEFQNCFGHLYSPSALDELEKHESSNFRHLWPTAFAMHYKRGIRIRDFGNVHEREAKQLLADFYMNLVSNIEGVLGKNSVSLGSSPWILDGERHLQIVCNHFSAASLDGNRERVVIAIWKACNFKQWRNMEWQPLVIEWPKIAVVHLLKGRALEAACIRLPTQTLCANYEKFEPQQHQLLATPLKHSQFATTGIPLIDNPLCERLLKLQGAVIAFCVTVPRFFDLIELCSKHNLQKPDIDRILPRYCNELSLVWQQALAELELFQHALTACVFPQVPAWKENILSICHKLLFSARLNQSLKLSFEDFETWSASFEFETTKLRGLGAEILSALIFEQPHLSSTS